MKIIGLFPKLIEKGRELQKKLTKAGCTEGALMTSQLRHYFQACQADDITSLHFKSQVNSLSVCGPQVDSFIY